MTFDLAAPALHAAAYDAGHAAGRRDREAGRRSADLALESWLHQGGAHRNDYADSFRSGYMAGHDR